MFKVNVELLLDGLEVDKSRKHVSLMLYCSTFLYLALQLCGYLMTIIGCSLQGTVFSLHFKISFNCFFSKCMQSECHTTNMESVIKMDFMVKRSQMKGRLLLHENYKSRWFKLTDQFLYYCDGKLEVSSFYSTSVVRALSLCCPLLKPMVR